MLSERLRETVGRISDGGRVVSVDLVQELWSGYGNIWRVRLTGGSVDGLVIKDVNLGGGRHPRGWNSNLSHRRKHHSYLVEIAWYQGLATSCHAQCRIPRCYAAESRSSLTLVLEDLDEVGYPLRHRVLSPDGLHACLDWLACFHATFLGVSSEGLWERGTYWHLDTRPDELEVLEDGRLKSAARELDDLLHTGQFLTLVHGDAKLANFCFSDNGNVAAVDFQYIGGGCGMKDVAYFLGSCLDEADLALRADGLVDYYCNRLTQALREHRPEVDSTAVVVEWRPLFPVAWADFHRFIKGWCPGHPKDHRFSEQVTERVLQDLGL